MNFSLRYIWITLLYICFYVLCFLSDLFTGSFRLNVPSFLLIINQGFYSETGEYLVIDILPRLLSATMVGAGFAVSCVCLNYVLNSRIAEPFSLGSVYGASLGILFAYSLEIQSFTLLYIFGAAGGFLPFFIFFYLLRNRELFHSPAVTAMGMVISLLFFAIIIFFLSVANSSQNHSNFFFIVGNLGETEHRRSFLGLPTLLSTMFLLYYLLWSLNSEDKKNSGNQLLEKGKGFFGKTHVEIAVILFVCMLIAICVSICGAMGFVGFTAVFFARIFVGTDVRILMPIAAIAGSSLCLMYDAFSRFILPNIHVPVGIVSMFFGVPIFFYVLIQEIKK